MELVKSRNSRGRQLVTGANEKQPKYTLRFLFCQFYTYTQSHSVSYTKSRNIPSPERFEVVSEAYLAAAVHLGSLAV